MPEAARKDMLAKAALPVGRIGEDDGIARQILPS